MMTERDIGDSRAEIMAKCMRKFAEFLQARPVVVAESVLASVPEAVRETSILGSVGTIPVQAN